MSRVAKLKNKYKTKRTPDSYQDGGNTQEPSGNGDGDKGMSRVEALKARKFLLKKADDIAKKYAEHNSHPDGEGRNYEETLENYREQTVEPLKTGKPPNAWTGFEPYSKDNLIEGINRYIKVIEKQEDPNPTFKSIVPDLRELRDYYKNNNVQVEKVLKGAEMPDLPLPPDIPESDVDMSKMETKPSEIKRQETEIPRLSPRDQSGTINMFGRKVSFYSQRQRDAILENFNKIDYKKPRPEDEHYEVDNRDTIKGWNKGKLYDEKGNVLYDSKNKPDKDAGPAIPKADFEDIELPNK